MRADAIAVVVGGLLAIGFCFVIGTPVAIGYVLGAASVVIAVTLQDERHAK